MGQEMGWADTLVERVPGFIRRHRKVRGKGAAAQDLATVFDDGEEAYWQKEKKKKKKKKKKKTRNNTGHAPRLTTSTVCTVERSSNS
jgi:hypothetical protein